MRLFSKKLPCPNCRKPVPEPSMGNDILCPACGKPGPWASPSQAEAWLAKEEKARQKRENDLKKARSLPHISAWQVILTCNTCENRWILSAEEAIRAAAYDQKRIDLPKPLTPEEEAWVGANRTVGSLRPTPIFNALFVGGSVEDVYKPQPLAKVICRRCYSTEINGAWVQPTT